MPHLAAGLRSAEDRPPSGASDAQFSLIKRAMFSDAEPLVAEPPRRAHHPYLVLTVGLLLTALVAVYIGVTAEAHDASQSGALLTRHSLYRGSPRELMPLMIGAGILLSVAFFSSARAEALARAEAQRRADDLRASERARREGEQWLRHLSQAEGEARRSAEAASRTRDEFLATLSHELRTPLTAVMGWVGILRRRSLDPDALARGLEVIERNLKLEAQLIDDLLDASQLAAGKLRLNAHPVELGPSITTAIDAALPAANARSIHIEVDLAAASEQVMGDENRLRQVFWNLLNNAVRFTPPGGQVTVRAARVGAELVVTVADTGKGISAEFLPYVFDRFRQADSSFTRSAGGLGLGLAIVRHLVELHGGTVSAASSGEGRGAIFTVRLPRLNAP